MLRFITQSHYSREKLILLLGEKAGWAPDKLEAKDVTFLVLNPSPLGQYANRVFHNKEKYSAFFLCAVKKINSAELEAFKLIFFTTQDLKINKALLYFRILLTVLL
jgi:hypothetical protein